MIEIPTDYEKIDNLVKLYQNGDKDAAEELVMGFEPYLSKYVNLLKYDVVDIMNRDTRGFLSVFINDRGVRTSLSRNKLPKHAYKAIHDVAAMLNKTCIGISEEDLHQELIVILLTLAKRFKKRGKKKNFCGYVYNTFRYELARRIMDMTRDPIAFRADLNIRFDDEVYDAKEMEISMPVSNMPMVEDDDDLGHNWILGHTCGDEFAELTRLERIILKMALADEMDDMLIGEQLGMHRHTIRKKKARAIEKVEQYYGKNRTISQREVPS